MIVVRQRVIQVALVSVGDRSIVESVGVVWTQLNRFVEVIDRLVVFRFEPIGDATIVVGNGEPVQKLPPSPDHGRAALDREIGRAMVLTESPILLCLSGRRHGKQAPSDRSDADGGGCSALHAEQTSRKFVNMGLVIGVRRQGRQNSRSKRNE